MFGESVVEKITMVVPRDQLEMVADMRFPLGVDKRMQHLMDSNNDGQLNPEEHNELKGLAEMSEIWSLVRAHAMIALGRRPS
jgi:hypothetical protein